MVALMLAIFDTREFTRLRSGSIWPAVIYHGAENAITQATFDRATAGTFAAVGESGWLTGTSAVIVMLIFTRRSTGTATDPTFRPACNDPDGRAIIAKLLSAPVLLLVL